jgi:UDP-2,4-diacetamido-2,4,6-trideoxy-beta-L-altropyranose hydrolase
MKYHFGIRVDMGGNIGSGHLFRCLALARELKRNRKKVVFLISNKKNFLEHVYDEFPNIKLKGKNEGDFLKQCQQMEEIDVLIIDLGSKNTMYSKKLKNRKTVILDDIGNKKISSSVLINGSMVNSFHKYQVGSKKSKLFLGIKYMILRKEFLKFRNKFKVTKKPIKNILLTFGGSDDLNLTLKLIPYFFNKKYLVTIVLGPSYKQKIKLEKIIKDQTNFKLKSTVKNMAKLLTEQDLVLTSSGITIYELACLGVPCLIFPASKIQNIAATQMTKSGFGINIGLRKKYNSNILNIINTINFDLQKSMYLQGRKNIDGKGLERNTKIILDLLSK